MDDLVIRKVKICRDFMDLRGIAGRTAGMAPRVPVSGTAVSRTVPAPATVFAGERCGGRAQGYEELILREERNEVIILRNDNARIRQDIIRHTVRSQESVFRAVIESNFRCSDLLIP